MLRRFADARLRSDLARETRKRKDAQDLAHRLGARLTQAQADRDFARAEAKNIYGTLKTIESERNAACALAAELLRDERAAERARTQETQP